MNAATDYVGVEPEGLRLLASSLDAAEADLSYTTSRISALLEEAGDSEGVPEVPRALGDEWNTAEADLPPFDLTDPPRRFFELLWLELFGDTKPEEVVPDISDTEVDFDPTACNRMRIAPSDAPDVPPDLLPVPSQI